MPVDTKHSSYAGLASVWKRNRDMVSGQDAIKAAGETYLPRLGGQSDAEYKAYKLRALCVNFTARTVDGLVGLIFRKDPALVIPAALKKLADDIDLAGSSLAEFAKRLTEEDVITGRGGILVEYPRAEIRERTVEELAAEGLRPYLTYYPAESIIDWRQGRVGNRMVTTMVKLLERTDAPDPADEWARISVQRIRVYELVRDYGPEFGIVALGAAAPEGYEGQAPEPTVSVRVFQKDQIGHPDWALVDGPFPIIMRGKPAAEIPFVFFPEANPGKAPITDLVDVNLAHYRTAADYENGNHWIGVPTPVFTGDFATQPGDGDVTEVRLGSSSGIHLAEGGDAKYLEFQGQGLEGNLGKSLERKEAYMAVLGARLLSSEKRQVEAAETASIHRSGENSVLASLANSISRAITRALGIMAEWAGVTGEISFALNTDYLPTQMDAQTLTALVAAWQGGALSSSELFEALVAGEVIRSEKDETEHEKEIEAESARRAEDAAAKLAATAAALAAKGAAE